MNVIFDDNYHLRYLRFFYTDAGQEISVGNYWNGENGFLIFRINSLPLSLSL